MAKSDNSNPEAKLLLRRYFMEKYHSGGAKVFDACQGHVKMWAALRNEFNLASYWGVDQKKDKGRIKVDSARILSMPGWDFDVIDIDTYGEPWKHWISMLPNIGQSTTVFLTIGQAGMATSRIVMRALGLASLPVPPGIQRQLHDMAVDCFLTMTDNHGIVISEMKHVVPAGATRYIGLRLTKQSGE